MHLEVHFFVAGANGATAATATAKHAALFKGPSSVPHTWPGGQGEELPDGHVRMMWFRPNTGTAGPTQNVPVAPGAHVGAAMGAAVAVAKATVKSSTISICGNL